MYKYLLYSIAILCAISCKQQKERISKKPNILFIFTDDQTYNSIKSLGNNEIKTPNMDKLVTNGTTFTHAYNMGSWSGAVCAASRAMLNSGRFVWRAHKFRKNWTQNDSITKTWAKLLEQQGYETYFSGKWHVDAPAKSVFNNVKHVRPGMPKDHWNHFKMVAKFDSIANIKNANPDDLMPLGYNRPKHENDSTWLPTDKSQGGFWQGGLHWSEVLKNDALEFLKNTTTKKDPFFMYLAFNAPHDPRQAPQEFQDLYDIHKIKLPKSYLAEYPYRKHIGNDNSLRDEALAPFPRTAYAIKTHIKEYYASISHVDAQIGQIIEALEQTGKLKNTYIFFTADHGLAMGRHGLLGKQNLFDHSIRAPLIVLGPDIPKNKKNTSDVYLQDIMATTLELAAVEKPKYIEFTSFLQQAKQQTNKSNYKAIYGAYLQLQRMIRKDNFKLLVYPKIDTVLLFDLEKDPEEMNNLANKPQYKNKVKKLFKELMELQQQMEDPLDLKPLFNKL